MQTYTVKRGDTLGKIARKFYGDAGRFPLIVSANRIADPDRLQPGQRLILPDADAARSAFASVSVPSPAPSAATVEPTPLPGASGDRMRTLNSQRLARVHPRLAELGLRMVDLCAQSGVAVLITQGLRTWQEQDALYAQGRSAPGKIVTNARGGQSWHNFGLAFDIVVLDSLGKAEWDTAHPGWKLAAAIGKSLGLEWGGDWKSFKDLPHFQLANGLTLAKCRALFPKGLERVWERVA
jgi:LysM repeat protein